MNNNSTVTTEKPVSTGFCDQVNWYHDVIVVTLWTVLLVYGLVTNILTMCGILRKQSLRSLTSYWLILSLAACDTIMILISLLHIVPATAAHENFLPMFSYRNYMANFMYNIFWYTGVLCLSAMALNRFFSIVYPISGQKYFSRERSGYLIAVLFTGGLLVALPAAFECCHLYYNHYCYITDFTNPDLGYHYAHADLAINTCVVTVMIVCYTAIFVKVRRSRLNTQRFNQGLRQQMLTTGAPGTPLSQLRGRQSADISSPTQARLIAQSRKQAAIANRELRLLVQFFVVSIVFTATFATWQLALNVLSSTKWHYFLMTSLFFVNNATNPTVYVIFNSALRAEIRGLLGFCFEPCKKGPRQPDIEVRKASYANDKLVRGENEALILASDGGERSNGNNSQQLLREENELKESSGNLTVTTSSKSK